MPEPSTAPPEQPPVGTPGQEQQAAVTAQPEPGADQPTPEQIAQWRTQAEQATALQQQLQQASESARYHQSQASRYQQALAHVNGNPNAIQPNTPDPLAQDVKFWTDQQYSEKDARAMAQFMNAKLAPLQQTLQATQYQTQVGMAMQQAHATPQLRGLMENPEVYSQVEAGLRNWAAQGGQPDVNMVNELAMRAYGELQWKAQQQPQAQPAPAPPYQPQPNFTQGAWRPQQGYQAPVTRMPAAPEGADIVLQELQTRYPGVKIK